MWGRGLPNEGNFQRLLYNPPSECLVAAFQRRLDETRWTEELYYRHKSSSDYEIIPGSSSSIHYCHVASCAKAPIIFFNVTRWSDDGGDWESLSSFNFKTQEIRAEVTPTNLAKNGVYDAWISALISIDNSGNRAICTFAFKQPIVEGRAKVEYWLCDLQISDLQITKISVLPQCFT